jgi:hypothetical protein
LGGGPGSEACFFECDQAAGELEKGEVVLVFLRPADEKRAVAVHPRVAGLNDPPAGAPARRTELAFDLFAARADVRREAARAEELAHAVVVVAAVEAEPLRLGRLRRGPLDRDRVKRRG